jgi:hypothetical protein
VMALRVEKAQRNWKTIGSSPPNPTSSRRLWQQATNKQDKQTMRMVDLLWPALNFQTERLASQSVYVSSVTFQWIHTKSRHRLSTMSLQPLTNPISFSAGPIRTTNF